MQLARAVSLLCIIYESAHSRLYKRIVRMYTICIFVCISPQFLRTEFFLAIKSFLYTHQHWPFELSQFDIWKEKKNIAFDVQHVKCLSFNISASRVIFVFVLKTFLAYFLIHILYSCLVFFLCLNIIRKRAYTCSTKFMLLLFSNFGAFGECGKLRVRQ